ncbi:MAG: hypothetical protein QM541_01335 [Flavobacterium sp.]|nr:hypothetical protein [Flavobacterium sp.]
MKLDKHFVDLFDGSGFSRNEITIFATDHLAKLKNNNSSNIYAAIITATEAKLKAFKDTRVETSSTENIKLGSTDTKNTAKDNFLAFVRRKKGTLKDIFYQNKPAYLEFYPQDLQEYNEASLEDLVLLAQRCKTVTAKYVTHLGAAFKTEMDMLADAYISSRGTQVSNKGLATDVNLATNAQRKALTVQLTQNVHTIAANNVDNAEALNTYFTESLLYNDVSTKQMPTKA